MTRESARHWLRFREIDDLARRCCARPLKWESDDLGAGSVTDASRIFL